MNAQEGARAFKLDRTRGKEIFDGKDKYSTHDEEKRERRRGRKRTKLAAQ